MELKNEIRVALENIFFIDKYKKLSMKYDFDSSERFRVSDNQEVLNIFNDLGYKAIFSKKETFFKVVDNMEPYKFQFNVSLKAGHTELIWAVWKNGELQTGLPWVMFKRLLDGTDENLKYPVFRNYNDLKQILQEALDMFENFKRELLSINNSNN